MRVASSKLDWVGVVPTVFAGSPVAVEGSVEVGIQVRSSRMGSRRARVGGVGVAETLNITGATAAGGRWSGVGVAYSPHRPGTGAHAGSSKAEATTHRHSLLNTVNSPPKLYRLPSARSVAAGQFHGASIV